MVEVEAETGAGLPRTVVAGLPDAALHESMDRCRAAVTAAGLRWPAGSVRIDLLPAGLPKAGSHYDMAIIAAVLAATGDVAAERVAALYAAGTVMLGEVGLDGAVRPVRGVLPALMGARDAGATLAYVPAAQMGEASLAGGLAIQPVADVRGLVAALNGRPIPLKPGPALERPPAEEVVFPAALDLRTVLDVAAAGGHHVLLNGGTSQERAMFAKTLAAVLPDLTTAKALQVAQIRSLAGQSLNGQLDMRPPLAVADPNITMAGLLGGGARMARPGAVSLAHLGILDMPDAPNLAQNGLEALRQPMVDGQVLLARSHGRVEFPARFQLVAGADKCPCGNPGPCGCTPAQMRRWDARISGTIADRIDIETTLRPPQNLAHTPTGGTPWRVSENVADAASRAAEARDRMAFRLRETGWTTSAQMPGVYARHELGTDADALIQHQTDTGRLSVRKADAAAKLAWTVADLAGHDRPTGADVQQALSLAAPDVATPAEADINPAFAIAQAQNGLGNPGMASRGSAGPASAAPSAPTLAPPAAGLTA